jgi:hypothetical protein
VIKHSAAVCVSLEDWLLAWQHVQQAFALVAQDLLLKCPGDHCQNQSRGGIGLKPTLLFQDASGTEQNRQ